MMCKKKGDRLGTCSIDLCSLCGYVEVHGNYVDEDGRIYCDECLISGDCLDIKKMTSQNKVVKR